MYPNITNDIVFLLYRYQIILIAGIIVACILARYKTCWLAYFAGVACQAIPMWEDYQYLAFNNYTSAMSGVIITSVVVAIVGAIIVRNRQKAKNRERNSVMFYCPRCRIVNPGMPGELQGCPTCHKPTNQTVVLTRDWAVMTPDQQEYMKNSWEA